MERNAFNSANSGATRRLIRRARRAFTLVEMLVSLGVLVIALAIVTNVFSLTTKTASVASALTDAEAAARSMLADLQADLDACDPARSPLVIIGRTQLAGLTEQDMRRRRPWRLLVGDINNVPGGFSPDFTIPNPPNSQYSDPRADLLMFFTQRPSTSVGPPQNPGDDFGRRLQRGDPIDNVQVMYGHGSLATLDNSFTWSTPIHIQSSDTDNVFSPLPLSDWTLTRRQVLLNDPGPFSTGGGGGVPTNDFQNDIGRVIRCATNDSGEAADALYFRLADYLTIFGAGGVVLPPQNLALKSPYQLTQGGGPWTTAQLEFVRDVLFPSGTGRAFNHFATVVERPPVQFRSNLGLRRLAGCAWFQVEFLMPEDPRNGRNHPNPQAAHEMPRWVEVPSGQTYVFVPDTQENRELVLAQTQANGQPAPSSRLDSFAQLVPPPPFAMGLPGPRYREVRMWPYAIRVTVRVFDRKGQLETPVTRSLVHWFD